MSARDEERHEWPLEVSRFEQRGEEVTFEVIDPDEGHVPGVGQRLCAREPD